MLKKSLKNLLTDTGELRTERTVLALVLTFITALVITLANGLSLPEALRSALTFALIAGAIVAMLAWGVDIARVKGYSGLLGFLLVLFLNFIGAIILLFLPNCRAPRTPNL